MKLVRMNARLCAGLFLEGGMLVSSIVEDAYMVCGGCVPCSSRFDPMLAAQFS